MDTSSQWPQGIGSVVVRAVENNTNKRPNKEQQANNLNCPRCNSNNTKFCYYNNYSLSQPRYLCKTCKRYWTEGGNLRSVPVGGGSRRNKRPSSPSSINTSTSSKKVVVVPNNNIMAPPPPAPQNPKTGHDHIGRQTLNLDFSPSNGMVLPEFGALPFGLTFKNPQNQNPSFCSSGFSNYNNYLPFSSLITMPPLNNPSNSLFDNMHDRLKPNLGFENNLQAASSSRVVFPFEELSNKPVSTSEFDEQGKRQQGDLNEDWNNGSW